MLQNTRENSTKILQENFLGAILSSCVEAIPDFIASHYSDSEAVARFNIYRNNIVENLKNALRLTFPGIWKLIGEECANSVAHAFVQHQTNWPVTGCLDDWGEGFIEFLGTIPELEDLYYLKDFALYEWHCHVIYCAQDAVNNISRRVEEKLAAVPEELIDRLKFDFIPACYLYQSCFPIQQIEAVVLHPEIEQVNLSEAGAYGIIVKIDFIVETHWLDEKDWLFVKKLYSGMIFGEAVADGMKEASDFDLTAVISKILQMKIIQGIILPE
jgi:hypothetical protein